MGWDAIESSPHLILQQKASISLTKVFLVSHTNHTPKNFLENERKPLPLGTSTCEEKRWQRGEIGKVRESTLKTIKAKPVFYHNTTDIKALLYLYANFSPGGQISLITDSAEGGALKHLSLKLATYFCFVLRL